MSSGFLNNNFVEFSVVVLITKVIYEPHGHFFIVETKKNLKSTYLQIH